MLAHNIGNQDKGSGSALNGKAQQQLTLFIPAFLGLNFAGGGADLPPPTNNGL